MVGASSAQSVPQSWLSWLDAEMRVKEIHGEVERVLGGSVSRYSVSDYLLTRSKGPRPLFIRTRHGHYRMPTDRPARDGDD
jgi:hypothetical protein